MHINISPVINLHTFSLNIPKKNLKKRKTMSALKFIWSNCIKNKKYLQNKNTFCGIRQKRQDPSGGLKANLHLKSLCKNVVQFLF